MTNAVMNSNQDLKSNLNGSDEKINQIMSLFKVGKVTEKPVIRGESCGPVSPPPDPVFPVGAP